ncbi:subtilisin family serine protease [Saccharothrix carnea]|uniref:Subtilisin family serine protease n=1 Tax=Saccharothrix carnea TaxID=1280637 RepID=A0A2P8ICK7_SACCR|nr:S8 family serine peptidase [Saccharothrix carnea]PSL56202.1 subtilisin family serine protease [Saccharothrix carnea]
MFRPRKRGKALGAAVLALGLLSTPVAGAEPAGTAGAGTARAAGAEDTGAAGAARLTGAENATATDTEPTDTGPTGSDTQPRTVTLITGDRVVVTGAAVGSFQPGPGRDRVTFHSTHRDGRLSVVPEDAAKAVAEGRLDPRLFDVTGLVEAGYDDARTDHLPLIVTGTPTGLRSARALPGAMATAAPKAEVGATFRALLTDPGVTKVWLDGVLRPTLDRSTAQIGAPTAWRAGYTGKGVKVAVLDGGVDGAHPDLKGKEVAERNFTDDPDATDLTGHGTHVAATIASGDRAYRGVAPDARILDGKVCGGNGCPESWILAGVQWAVDEGADIVNLSLGGYDSPGVDPLEDAINQLTAKTGTLFVVAAGNGGRSRSIDSPGSADAALTVGAVRHDDDLAHFSSRGPRNGDDAVKPDITAPGLNIVAAKAAKGVLGTPVGRRHASLSGTSMATPHVAGAAALLAQQHPDWTGAQLKAALMASAKPNPALGVFDQGAGRVDVTRALTATTGAEPVSLTFEEQLWPHHDDTPVTKTVTYRNSGPEPIAFDLAVELRGGAPAGLVTVDPARVTVPAGGTATVAVTADTRVGAVDGVFSGVLVGGPTRVPISLAREVESYDVAIEHVDVDGNPALDNSVALVGMDNNVYENLYGPDGTATARVPKGEYMARAVIRSWPRTWVLGRPALTVDADHTRYTFDARVAKPLQVTAPDPTATPMIGDINVSRLLNGRRVVLNTAFIGGFGDMAIGHVGPTLTAEELTVSVGAQFQSPPVDGTPTHYRFRWMEPGAVPTGYTRAPTKDELTEVRTAFAPGPADRQYLHSGNASPPDGSGGWSVGLPVPAGGEVIDLLTPDQLTWSWGYQRLSPQYRTEADYSSFHRRYRLGERYAERFAHPVLGPGLAGYSATYLGVHEDRVTAQIPLINDRDGNLGRGSHESARTSVYRDGRLVGQVRDQWGEFTVPEGAGHYRVEHDIVRDPAAHELTTRVSGAWTFRMETLPDGHGRRLPMSVVRFEPELDAAGSAPAGRLLRVPLAVEQQDGADNGEVGQVRVDVSFDDGRTWRRVPVTGGAALVPHPDAAGYASLRASGSDSDGNTFEHTVIRAYRITR